jgi:hypothetical protein
MSDLCLDLSEIALILDVIRQLLSYEILSFQIIFLIDDKIKTNPEIETVTDILNTLENSKSFEDVLSIFEHVFGHMNNYPEYEDKSFYQLIRKCRLVKRKFGCSNIIGREKEIREAIKALESSDNNGKTNTFINVCDLFLRFY